MRWLTYVSVMRFFSVQAKPSNVASSHRFLECIMTLKDFIKNGYLVCYPSLFDYLSMYQQRV